MIYRCSNRAFSPQKLYLCYLLKPNMIAES
jgi:hypothetical protein